MLSFMLSVVILSATMLCVVMLSVITLSVVALSVLLKDQKCLWLNDFCTLTFDLMPQLPFKPSATPSVTHGQTDKEW
jgi:hypothetical protein